MTTDVEQHRLACEAREVAKRPLWQRRAYLDEVQKSRGKTAADALRAALKAIWDAREAAKAAT